MTTTHEMTVHRRFSERKRRSKWMKAHSDGKLCSPCLPTCVGLTLLPPLQPASVRKGAHRCALQDSERNRGSQQEFRTISVCVLLQTCGLLLFAFIFSFHPAFFNCHLLCSIFLLDLTYMTISDVSVHGFDCPHITSYPTHF